MTMHCLAWLIVRRRDRSVVRRTRPVRIERGIRASRWPTDSWI